MASRYRTRCWACRVPCCLWSPSVPQAFTSRAGAPRPAGRPTPTLPRRPHCTEGSVWAPAAGISAGSQLPQQAPPGAPSETGRRLAYLTKAATALTWGPGTRPGSPGPGPRRPARLRPPALTCVPSRLARAFVHALQLGHPVLEGLHAALHAACFLPALPEGADLFVKLLQFLCLAVYYSLPHQRCQKGKIRLELAAGAAPLPSDTRWSGTGQPASALTGPLTLDPRASRGTQGPRPLVPGGDRGTERPHPPGAGHAAPTSLCPSVSAQDLESHSSAPSEGLHPLQGRATSRGQTM